MRPDARAAKLILSYPPTWAAVGMIAAAEWGFIRWFEPSMTMTAVTLGLSLGLLFLWPVLFVRSAAFGQLYLQLPDELKAKKIERLKLLESDLERLGSEQGVQQLQRIGQKLDDLTEVLKRRLNAGELTYGRYLGTAEQVYLSALDNLHDVAVALTSVNTVDPKYIDNRLRELRGIEDPSDEQQKEAETLAHRRSLLDQQTRKAADLLAQNESAMTVLVNAAAALSDTNTGKDRMSTDAETAMVELELLAKRAGRYATTS